MYINSPLTINRIADDQVEINTLTCILDIVRYLKAFYCDIFGSFIYNWRVLGEIKNEPISFRIDPVQLFQLINVLGLHFSIIEESSSIPYNYYPCYSYTLVNINFPANPVKINAYLVFKKIFKTTFPLDFDINLLVEDDSSTYVRVVPPSIKYTSDKITFLRERICNKRFCMIESLSKKATPQAISQTVETAIDLIKNGWTMDNCLEKKTWIVVRWKDLICNTSNHRLGILDDKKDLINNCNECCLCQEKFLDNDIVINTQCNHNFHWMCNGNSNFSGLKNWVQGQNKLCCPFCRTEIF
jgi:hypothetical protein